MKSVDEIEEEVNEFVGDTEAGYVERRAAALRAITMTAAAESDLQTIASVQTLGLTASPAGAIGSGALSGLIGWFQKMFKRIWNHLWILISHLTNVKEWSVKFSVSMGFLPGGGGEIEIKFG